MSTSTAAFLAFSCVGAFSTAPVWGEEDKGVAPPADDQRRDEVVVNGRRAKRDDPKQVASLVDTPKSIMVLPAEVIEQTGSNSLQDALRTVPGVTLGAAEGGNPIGDRPFIRGFDSQGSIYIDGVRDLASQTREVFDTDAMEIVRGSDSTLGGRGSVGGTLNIRSKLPQQSDFASASASFGNADYRRVSGDVNLAVAEQVGVRVAGVWHDQGFAGRDAIHARRWGVAPSVTLGVGTPTRLTAAYYHLQSHELPDSGIPYAYVCSATVCNAPGTGAVVSRPVVGPFTTISGQAGVVKRSAFYGLKDRDFRDAATDQVTVRIEHDFGALTLRNTARISHDEQAYSYTQPDDSQGDVYGFAASGGGYVWRRANTRYGYAESIIDQTDLYGRFQTGAIEHSIAIGTELSWEKTRRGAYVLATGATIGPRCGSVALARSYCTSLFDPHPDDPWVNYAGDTSAATAAIVRGGADTETQNEANTQSVYGFDSITLAPAVILNLGARYDRYASALTPPAVAGAGSYRLSRTDRLFNWQAGLVVKPTREVSLYASYATAATPPNSLLGEGREDNALPTTNAAANLALLDQLKVQKTRSYEIGAKAALAHARLQLGAAAFRTEIDNARVTVDASTVAFLGRTRVRGIELTASGTILPGWTVFGGYTFLDAVVVDGGNAALTAPAVGARAAQTVYVSSVNTGKQAPQTVRNSFTASTNVTLRKRFQIGGSAIHNDRQFGGYADDRAATQDANGVVTVSPATRVIYREVPGYWRFDARASVDLSRPLTLAVNVQNLTDKVYFSQANASHYAAIAPGRTVFGSLSVKF